MPSLQDELEALRAQVAQLTARIYRLEQILPAHPVAEPETSKAPEVTPSSSSSPEPSFRPPVIPPVPPVIPAVPTGSTVYRPAEVQEEEGTLEKRIGQYWLNRVGIVAILVGVAYFLKYAFDNGWIGPTGRIVIGIVLGIAIIVWSEWFRSRAYTVFSYSLKAVGIGTLYLCLWAAFQIYHLLPSSAAFAAMLVVTASTIVMALTQDAEILAAFALAGGFSTPLLLSTGQNHEVVLFSYTCLLDAAMLAIAVFKPWRRLMWGSFVGTIILYWGWYMDYYTKDQRGLTVIFASLMAAIFASVPLVTPYERSTRFDGPSVTLTALPLFNAGFFFLALFAIHQNERDTLTWYALALAAVYLLLSNIFRRRFTGEDARIITLLHLAIAVTFITIAIPLKLHGHWITIGWLVEALALVLIGSRTEAQLLRIFGLAALALGIVRVLVIDDFHTTTLIFNARFAAYLVAIAVLGCLVILGRPEASPNERLLAQVAGVTLNVLALVALSLEAADYFSRAMDAAYAAGRYSTEYHELRLARDLSFSAIWLGYAVLLMVVGFKKQSAMVRWQALILMIFTIGKVFLYDVFSLGGGYRIVSVIALGVVLLAMSFVYQRDWLKLTAPE